MFIYIRTNEWFKQNNVYKVGITTSIKDRSNNYITGEIVKGYYVKIFNLNNINKNKLHLIDKIIKIKFKKLNVYNDGGTEFYEKSIINEIEKYLTKINISFTTINEDELKRINRNKNIKNNFIKLIYKYIDSLNELEELEELNYCYNDNDNYQDKLRDYQEIIINECLLNINKDNRVYMSLATGGGKSKITYSIFNELLNKQNKNTIIIFTPRINICNQNIQNKYLNILLDEYFIYNKDNLNKIKNTDNNIICCCINSIKKVANIIKTADLKNVIIWFDEAHYGIDNWLINSNIDKDFILNDNNYIKYRIFTSASPDKDLITKNNKIFGEFINPIKIKYLMDNDWLCKLNIYIYKDELSQEISENNTKIFIDFLIDRFIEKNVGLCFSNSCDNALELFITHLELFKKDNNIPKPFLLLNSIKIDEYINYNKISHKNNDLFNIREFEREDDGKRIGYIVKMYSMGYDNKDIDLLIFKDPKMSDKDIIQSIGRGLRPDALKENGKNYNKNTDIILPVYINNIVDDANKFDKIKEVLKYLLLEVELKMKNINIISKKNKKKEIENIEIIDDKEIDFIKDIESIMYEIQNTIRVWTQESIIRQLKYNDINDYTNYLKYINENPQLKLPSNLYELFPLFNFNDTYKNNLSPYYTREECINNIDKYKRILTYNKTINKKDNKSLLKFLVNCDTKIPNQCLWNYYGGNKEDFIIFV